MEDNTAHFLCGICKAGFRSSSFLQFIEHMIRHSGVGRSNKCMICQKGFARIPTLRDHMLHFHAVPLKIGPDSSSYAETDEKNLLPGSARCNLFPMKEIVGDQSTNFELPTPNHCRYKNVCLLERSIPTSQTKFDTSERTSSDILNACCLEQSPSPVCIESSNSWVKSSNVFMENSNSSIDVLTIGEIDQNMQNDIPLTSNNNGLCPLSDQNRNDMNSNCESDLLSFGRPAQKDSNSDLFLLQAQGDEMNFVENFDKSISGKDINNQNEDTEIQPYGHGSDSQDGIVFHEDNSSVVHLGSCGNNMTKLNSETYDHIDKMSIDLPENVTQCSNIGRHELNPLDLSNTYNGLSTNASLHPQNERAVMLAKTVHHISDEVNGIDKEMPPVDTEGLEENNVCPSSSKGVKTKVPKRKSNSTHDGVVSKVHEDIVDFHFFLGSTVISGSSITYNRTEFRCLHCSFVCAWRPSLVKHMKSSHSEALDFHKILDIRNLHSKSYCDDKLKKYKVMKLSEHIVATSKVKKRKKRGRGLEKQDLPGKYNCPICNKVFRRLRYLRRHEVSHRAEKSHLCDTCGKSFKTKASLVAHYRSHKSRSYHCPQCDFVSNLTGSIHRHRQIHPNGSVVCDICGAAYIDKSTLKKHRRVHDISRPFSCTFPGCTWRFKTENMKRAHIKAHTTEGKFCCLHCGYRFRHKHHLQRHMSKVHSHVNYSTKYPSDIGLSSNLDSALGVVGSSVLLHHGLPSEDTMKNSTDLTLCSTRPLDNSQEILLSSISENLTSSHNIPSHSNIEIKLPPSSVDIYIEEKPDDSVISLGQENSFDVVTSNSLGNLEYVTEKGEIVHMVKPGQIIVRQDPCGNLVEYRIADARPGDETQSQQFFFIDSGGTVLGAASNINNSQEQNLLLQ